LRLAVLADIHGNLPALEAVLNDLEYQNVDGIIVAGDFIGGPQANETLRMVRSVNGWAIKGNSDINLINYAEGKTPLTWRTSQQFALLRWAYRNLDKDLLEYLQSLPEQQVVKAIPEAPVRIVHGSPRDPFESLFPDRDQETLSWAIAEMHEPVLICGHTHLPWMLEQEGKLILNPGAICGALNEDVRAQYATLTWHGNRWVAKHHAVCYDHKQLRNAFRQSGLLEEGGALARAFLLSTETGLNVADLFLAYAYRLAAETGELDCEVVPDEIWHQAASSFNWRAYEQIKET
jgi:putative phosphoesterase